MGNLKKVISLHQASRISGYHQDYLSSLIRKGEIKGQKMGGNWFTTTDEIDNYIFKQKIRNKSWITRNLSFFLKTHSSIIYALIFLAILSTTIYFYNKKYNEVNTFKVETASAEVPQTNKLKF